LQKQLDSCNEEWKKAFQMLQNQFINEIKKLSNNQDFKNEIKPLVSKIINNQLVLTQNNNNNDNNPAKLNGMILRLYNIQYNKKSFN
jgi:hypothetical protein